MIQTFKRILFLLCCMLSFAALAQNPIGPITISLPANPPADVSSWATTIPPVMITAQTKLQNGQVNGTVQESKILITIKQSGGKVCGSYTAQSAPQSNFNSATKTWIGAGVLQLLGQACTLAAGSYELCVEFYSINPAQPGIIGESCKPFTIADNKADNYTAPTNISPANEQQFKESDLKAPITFRWTPLVPKPQQPVIYRLKVWQLMQGQNGTAAMKSNPPLLTKDVENMTQTTISNFLTGPCRPPYLCDWIWNVEAISRNGEKTLGSSEPTSFRSNSAGCGTNSDSMTISCGQIINGKQTYLVSVKFSNTIPTTGGQQCTTVMNSITSSTGTLSAVATLPVTIPIGASTSTVTFIYTPTVSTAATASFAYQGIWNDGNSNSSNFRRDNIMLPVCRCTTCDQVQWRLPDLIKYDTALFKGTNNIMTLYGNVSFGSQKIVKLSAEIVDFYWYTEGDCIKCNNNDYYFGNLISGSATGLTATSIADGGGTPLLSSHQIDFISPTLSGVNLNTPISLNVSVPPQTQLSCCTDCFRFCIRYTATFMENGVCKTCSIVKCYESKRKHRKVGMQAWPQPNQCGDIVKPPQGEGVSLDK